jgi:hypothetical protein
MPEPPISSSLLSQRTAVGDVWEYGLTASGENLRPIVMALGHWGAQWIGSRLRDDQLDAGLLMWDVRRCVHLEAFPASAVVIQFSFRDARPGELTLVVDATVRTLTEVWAGDRTPKEVIRAQALRVDGREDDAQSLWRWLGTSAFAATRRKRSGPRSG